jgi:2'-5' RNA ligase
MAKNKNSKGGWNSKRPFIVLDVPPPMAERIFALRRHFGSWRVALPVEITLVGSSGLGVLRYHESELETIFDTLDGMARRFAPIVTHFSSVAMFPGTRVFYFVPDNAAPFLTLQAALVESGLRFERSPFPFTPHCTIADLETVAEELPSGFQALAQPDTEIVLDTLSVYNLDERVLGGNSEGCRLLHRTKLAAA